jgi:hypothetical protein
LSAGPIPYADPLLGLRAQTFSLKENLNKRFADRRQHPTTEDRRAGKG